MLAMLPPPLLFFGMPNIWGWQGRLSSLPIMLFALCGILFGLGRLFYG